MFKFENHSQGGRQAVIWKVCSFKLHLKITVSNDNILHVEGVVVFITFGSISEASTWLFWLPVYLSLLLDSYCVALFKIWEVYLFPLHK